MLRKLTTTALLSLMVSLTMGQTRLDTLLPVRGFCISAPAHDKVEEFNQFIREILIPNKINTLVLRVEYNYEYESHPELRSDHPLTKTQVKQIVKTCREGNIRIIPQVNLFGHQSWSTTLGKLLTAYPQFDETPHVEIPEDYQWPNPDGLYCKSYCPRHPDVHNVVFAVMDEIVEVFEADAYHAGLDEVFYIGDDKCPRCGGRDKAELFAGEVTKIRNHLAANGKELWIWGDRLLDGKMTGWGMWEASMNNTHRAIDMIPKDVVICDWHYEYNTPSAPIFAAKGFRVITCPWRLPEVTVQQLNSMLSLRASATAVMKPRYLGMMQTIWTGPERFMKEYYSNDETPHRRGGNVAKCFKTLCEQMLALEE